MEPMEQKRNDFDKAVESYQGSFVCAMVRQYADRGIVKAVELEAVEQVKKEEQTRKLAPQAYRLSSMSEVTKDIRYRRGKEHMSSADLVRYISDTRAEYLQHVDLNENTGMDVCEGGNVKDACLALTETKNHTKKLSVGAICRLPMVAGEGLKRAIPKWFDAAEPDTASNTRRFPLSAFAALLAVAASLFLIVASSVMVRLAESDVSRLKTQLSETSVQAEELRSDFNVGTDLLQIRRIASEEYGMVSEDYVKMDYISLQGEDSVEVYEERRTESIGLSALLSAIGLK